MKFKANKLEMKKLLNGNTELSVQIEDKKNALISQINGKKQLLTSDLEISIDKWRNKRSGGHNRLFWDMCQNLSDFIDDPLITADIIYKDLIREYGVSTIYAVRDDILEMVIRDWENRGDGWLTQVISKSSEEKDKTDVKFWWGSSVYDSKQFWRIMEGLKQMCKDNNLDISHYDPLIRSSIEEMEQKERETGRDK